MKSLIKILVKKAPMYNTIPQKFIHMGLNNQAPIKIFCSIKYKLQY